MLAACGTGLVANRGRWYRMKPRKAVIVPTLLEPLAADSSILCLIAVRVLRLICAVPQCSENGCRRRRRPEKGVAPQDRSWLGSRFRDGSRAHARRTGTSGQNASPHETQASNKASTKRSMSNSARSSGPSPSPTKRIGIPNSRLMGMATPPFAEPSSLARMMPVQ